MKLQKDISIFSGCISILALGMSYVFWCRNSEYLCNLCIGLFSSGILACSIAAITYFGERNRAILALYRGCYRFIEQINLNLRPDNRIGIETVRENFARMKESYNVDVYCFVNELSIMCKHSKLRKIIMDIWESARNVYLIILDDDDKIMQFYMGEISENDISNYKFKYLDSESVSWVKKLQKSLDELRYYMNYYNSRKEKRNLEETDNAD